MALSPGQAIARQENVEESLQPTEDSRRKSQLEKSRCQIEDRVDYRTVRYARTLAAKRGEQPMAWKDFKKKLDR
jgi:hypothetical protein